MQLVGIDCASKAENTGVALGEYKNNKVWISAVYMGNKKQKISDLIFSITNPSLKTIFAFDAPLGWSEPMGRLLAQHQAGEPLAEEQDRFFRRFTDTFTHQKTGKLPLEVGADRIGRTAYSALKIIGELREKGLHLPMLWQTDFQELNGAIEVYPSPTLKAHDCISSAYKGKSPEEAEKRQQIIQKLVSHLPNILDFPDLQDHADMLDAVVCLLCAKDFIEGNVYFPQDLDTAKKEGWIWVRK
jgi:predicted RNase H-like nuclease